MEITRNSLETNPGPSDWFTGSVYIDTVSAPSDGSRIGAAYVHFAPGARTAWHTHPHGQTIWVSDGVGLCQREGGPIEVIRPGDRASICGSDLWPYTSMAPSENGQSTGHEAIGVVDEIGADVRTLKRGDVVVMPFAISDGTCEFCHEGLTTACVHVGFFGNSGMNGAQAEALRIPYADGTLFPLDVSEDDALMPSLLTLSDVMGTGHHAAVAAKVAPGS